MFPRALVKLGAEKCWIQKPFRTRRYLRIKILDSINLPQDYVMGRGSSRGWIALVKWPHCPLPGSLEERGLIQWKAGAHANSEMSTSLKSYDFPIGMNTVKRTAFLKYIPICPVFKGFSSRSKGQLSVPEDTPQNRETGPVCTKVWKITSRKGRLLIYGFCGRAEKKITFLCFNQRKSKLLSLFLLPIECLPRKSRLCNKSIYIYCEWNSLDILQWERNFPPGVGH